MEYCFTPVHGSTERSVSERIRKKPIRPIPLRFARFASDSHANQSDTPVSEHIRRKPIPDTLPILSTWPGEVFSSSHEPVASVRLERILSGLQDIEYLKLYSARYGRDEGLALLEKTCAYLGPERYTLDHMPIDAIRAEIYCTCRSS